MINDRGNKMKKLLKRYIFFLFIFIIISFNLNARSLRGKINPKRPLLKFIVLDVWQGDSILVVFPNRKVMLVDAGLGGSEYSKFDAGKMVVLPYLKKHHIKEINYFIMTHPHSDHIGGMPYLLEHIKIDRAYDCGMPYATELYMRCLNLIDKEYVKYLIPRLGDYIKIDPRVMVKILHPSKDWEMSNNPNDNSIVVKIKYGKVSFLLTGDAEDNAEEFMLDEGLDLSATIIKVPHHGSDTSSSDDFIDAVNPEVAIISVGKNNKFGHPRPSTIAKYEERGVKIYRTDYDGTVEVITDGLKYEIHTEKIRDWSVKNRYRGKYDS